MRTFRRHGRGSEIRTHDLLLPKQARYQAALYPAKSAILHQNRARQTARRFWRPVFYAIIIAFFILPKFIAPKSGRMFGGFAGFQLEVAVKTFLFVATALFVTAAFFAVAVLVVASSGLDDETKAWLFSEGRPVEMLSAVAWFVSAAVVAFFGKTARRFALLSLPLFCGMRELDLHKAWTYDSVLKSRYWLGDWPIPLLEKALAAAILLSFLAAMLAAIKFYGREGIRRIREGTVVGRCLITALLFLAVAKLLLDGMGRKLQALGISADLPVWTMVAEETMELAGALLVFYAVVAVFVFKKQ